MAVNGCVASAVLISGARQISRKLEESGRLDTGKVFQLLAMLSGAIDYDDHIDGMACDRCGIEVPDGDGAYVEFDGDEHRVCGSCESDVGGGE